MKHIILLIVALLCMVGSNAQTRKPQMRKMGQTSQTVKGKTTSMEGTEKVPSWVMLV